MPHHSTVSRPALAYPEHSLSLDDMLRMAARLYGTQPNYATIERMIRNTRIETRHFALPIEQLEQLGPDVGLARRTALYRQHATELAERAARAALDHAAVAAHDIDAIITTSCTGFIMPSLDVQLLGRLGLRPTVTRRPIAQLGCVAGVSALAAANDHCRAHAGARVLIVAVELSSLCFHNDAQQLSAAVCAGIFGDGAAACVVAGRDAPGFDLRLHDHLSYTLPDSDHYIRFHVSDGGYQLALDAAVMRTVPQLAPIIRRFIDERHAEPLAFVLAHTGGPRILDGLGRSLALDDALLEPSRASLREAGNTASVSVFDVIARSYDQDRVQGRDGAALERGIVIAFGPGFTMEILSASRPARNLSWTDRHADFPPVAR